MHADTVVELAEKCKPFAIKLCRGNVTNANDLLQDAAIRALKADPKEVNTTNWFMTILRNTQINSYRDLSKKNPVLEAKSIEDSQYEPHRISNELSDAKIFISKVANKMYKDNAPLTQRAERILYLSWIESMSAQDIIDELEINITVTIVNRCLAKARKIARENYELFTA